MPRGLRHILTLAQSHSTKRIVSCGMNPTFVNSSIHGCGPGRDHRAAPSALRRSQNLPPPRRHPVAQFGGESSNWRSLAPLPKPGDVVQGRVTRLVKFGVFVQIEGGASGLVHISEIRDRFIHNVAEVLQVGEQVAVRVLSVDKYLGRISLSIKQAAPQSRIGYDRVVQLGGDWGHPWGDDPDTKWADLGPRPKPKPHYWQPNLERFRPFGDPPDSPSPPYAE